MTNQMAKNTVALVALLGVLLVTPATPVQASSCGDWEKGWGDEEESCGFECEAKRQLTASIGSDHSTFVHASAVCGGTYAECDGVYECGRHGGVTATSGGGQCDGWGKAAWYTWNTISIHCDDTHIVGTDAVPDDPVPIPPGPSRPGDNPILGKVTGALDNLPSWKCRQAQPASGWPNDGALQVLMTEIPDGTSVIAMRGSFYTDGNTAQTANLEGIKLTNKTCGNFTPGHSTVHVNESGTDMLKSSLTN